VHLEDNWEIGSIEACAWFWVKAGDGGGVVIVANGRFDGAIDALG
jgi:hypothetical protein